MMKSIEHWKSALMTLPENKFFELLRSVFGNIKTPFSKQLLLNDLVTLLSRREICRTISAYINGQDHKIIAAVALLNEPAPGDLETFFSGELSYAELHALIINLEERLILYRFRDGQILRLALNPVLEKALAPFMNDQSILFPSFAFGSGFAPESGFPEESPPSAESKSPELPLRINDNRCIAALISFIENEEDHLKAEGGLRKKIIDEWKKIFPDTDIELAVKVFLRMGFFGIEGRSLLPNGEKLADYSALSPAERREYWAAGLYISLCDDEAENNPGAPVNRRVSGPPPVFSRTGLRETAAFIRRFRSLVDADRLYPETTLRRFCGLLGRENDGPGAGPFISRGARLSLEPLLAVMEKADLLEKTGAFWKASPGLTVQERDNSVLAMDTAFSFILYPEISLSDALALEAFCSVKENTGTTVCFELTRPSAVRGFNRGMSAESVVTLLNRLSGNRLDPNLSYTVRDWETRYAGVSLHKGVVLILSEDRRYLAEAEPVASLVRRNLAPGVYLLSSEDRPEAARALQKAGVDIIAQPPAENRKPPPISGLPRQTPFPRLDALAARSFTAGRENRRGDSREETPPSPGEAEAIQENFRRVLDKRQLSKPEREELLARIQRRLVLTEAQLESAVLRYEKLEARGIDYAGKSMIASQAVESGSLVEVSWPGPDGAVNTTVGIPRALEKKGGEGVLVLNAGDAVPGDSAKAKGNTLRIPLGKISLLRRIKHSIFEE
jgi:hypothetical protein